MKFNRLREIREENEKSQSEVAKVLNITQGTYAMNETGADTITLNNLIKLCDLFEVSIDYILELSDDKNYKESHCSYDKDILCKRLKECRKEFKYTQDRIGGLLNIDHSVWCRYEKGITTIPTMFLYTICKKFNISADYLLGRTNEPKFLNK